MVKCSKISKLLKISHQYLPVGLAFYFSDKTSSVIENYVGETKTTYFWDSQVTGLVCPAAMLSLNIPQEQQISVGDNYIISMASNAYTSSNNLMSVGYTVVNGDTVNSIMSNLANIINNNKALNVNALAVTVPATPYRYLNN